MLRKALNTCLVAALALTMTIPAFATQTRSDGELAQLLINATDMDAPEKDLSVAVYTADASGHYQPGQTVNFSAAVNRITQDALIYITPNVDHVYLQIDYLTDLNKDGVWELMDAEQGGMATTANNSYQISATGLMDEAFLAMVDRNMAGYPDSDASTSPAKSEDILYMITTYSGLSDGGQRASSAYYLRIYDQIPILSAEDFDDVPTSAWYYSAVDYTLANGIFSGTGATKFSPDVPLTRAMLAQILYGLGGNGAVQTAPFLDVSPSAWYYNAVTWAATNSLMSGVGNNQFNPDGQLTREQMALILYQYTALDHTPSKDRADLSRFSDQAAISPWASDAMGWAVNEGLLAGRPSGLLDPYGPVTRAEFAAVIRALQVNVLEG